MKPLIDALAHWIIDSLHHWCIGSLAHRLTKSFIHWLIDSLAHAVSCAWILMSFHSHLNHHLLIRWRTSQLEQLNNSLLLHRTNFPICHWFPISASYFRNFCPGMGRALLVWNYFPCSRNHSQGRQVKSFVAWQNNFLTLDSWTAKNMACRLCDGGDTDSPLTPPLSPPFGGSNPEGWQPVATEVSRTAEVNINSLWFRHSTCAPGRLGNWGQRRALRRILTSDVWRVSNSQAIP